MFCRKCTGYKPCPSQCDPRDQISERILFVHLGAIGATLRSTALLAAIRRKHPQAHLTWVTETPSARLLAGHPNVDEILELNFNNYLLLQANEWQAAYVVDKSQRAAGLVKSLKIASTFGFITNHHGLIVPANPHAAELYELGLSNQKKFFTNQKTEQQLTHEALDLGPFNNDEYDLPLSAEEMEIAFAKRRAWSPQGQTLIGINVGCSAHLPHKKLSLSASMGLLISLMNRLQSQCRELRNVNLVLLGGGVEDEALCRNLRAEMASVPLFSEMGVAIIQSDTLKGLRDGLTSVAAVDLVITGDSLGMHMAISQKKWVVAWFGPSCEQEIDLYGRGEKIVTSAPCSPCWKRFCDREVMCYDQLNFYLINEAVQKGIQWSLQNRKCQSSAESLSFKQPFLEMSS